jgi:hypothetical protein
VTLVDVALVRFTSGAAITLVMGHPRRTPEGHDDTREGVACPPGSGPVPVLRVGPHLWRQA